MISLWDLKFSEMVLRRLLDSVSGWKGIFVGRFTKKQQWPSVQLSYLFFDN